MGATLLKRWETLATKVAFQNRWVRVVLDQVQLPNGQQYEYTRLQRDTQGVAIVVLDEGGQILLEQEYRHAVDAVVWQLPGGLYAPDEDPLVAAQRELREETGVEANAWHYLGEFYDNPALSNATNKVYLARDIRQLHPPEPDQAEFVMSSWHDLAWVRVAIRQGQITDRVVLCALALLWTQELEG